MKLKFDMIGLFVKDLHAMVAFYRDVVGLEIQWDGIGPYAEFRHEGIRFAMYERAQLPSLLGQEPSYPSGLNLNPALESSASHPVWLRALDSATSSPHRTRVRLLSPETNSHRHPGGLHPALMRELG